MKKISSIIIFLLVVLMLSSCGNKAATNEPEKGTQETTSETGASGTGNSETEKNDGQTQNGSVSKPRPQSSKGIEYGIHTDGTHAIVMSKGSCTEKNIVIASEYLGAPVTKIGEGAFKDADIESVYLPDTITVIYPYAFYNCRNLASINIPDSVSSIMNEAFGYCKKLYKVENGINYVGNWAVGCINDTTSELKISENTVGIAHNAFANGSFLGDIVIPNSVEHIGTAAFANAKIIQGSVVIGDGVEEILPHTFYKVEGMRSITIGKNVKKIGDFSFYNCRTLKELHISDGVTEIGESAFLGCDKMSTLTLPSSLKTVAKSAFSNCRGLITLNYTGNEEQWSKIDFAIGNEIITSESRVVNFNYTAN